MNISVIIPVFNRQQTIQRAIDSVLAQDYPATEVIVVDDGSTDDTASLIQRYKTVSYLHQTNQGVSAARNAGIKAATSEWIAFLDSDDEWLPHKLRRQLEAINQALQKGEEMKVCHGDEIWIRNGKRVNPMKKHAKTGGYIYTQCLPLCVISPSAVMIQRSVFESVGLFDIDLPACEDYDMWLRICSKLPVLFVSEPLLKKYGGHSDQLSRQYPAMDRFRIRAMEKILRSGELRECYQHATLEQLQRKFKIYRQGAIKHGNEKEAEALAVRLGDLLNDSDLPNG